MSLKNSSPWQARMICLSAKKVSSNRLSVIVIDSIDRIIKYQKWALLTDVFCQQNSKPYAAYMPLTEHMQSIKILRWIVLKCHLQPLILHQGEFDTSELFSWRVITVECIVLSNNAVSEIRNQLLRQTIFIGVQLQYEPGIGY